MSQTSRPDYQLNALMAEGQVDPGSKRLNIGLNQHNPIEAMDLLLADTQAMSIALHELTHFHSLASPVGLIFAYRGFLMAVLAETMKAQIESENHIQAEKSLRLFLRFHRNYTAMLNMWRPLLEGLAVFVQTSRADQRVDEVPIPIQSLAEFGLSLFTLNPRTSAIMDFDHITHGVFTAAQNAMHDGPKLRIDSEYTLAAALELKATGWSLPYFLGHAYIRGLHQRLAARVSQFRSPERFIRLILRIFQYSALDLLGCDASWTRAEDADRLYGWIELLQTAPHERLVKLAHIEDGIDPLALLRGSHRTRSPLILNTELADVLSGSIPTDWALTKDIDQTKRRVVQALSHTYIMNLTSGGQCRVAGWIPSTHSTKEKLFSLRLGADAWWVRLNEEHLQTLKLDASVLPRLPESIFKDSEGPIAREAAPELEIRAFLAHINEPSNSGGPQPRTRHFFEFRQPKNQDDFLLTELTPQKGRAILTVLEKATQEIFKAGEQAMRVMGRVPPLGELPKWLRTHSTPALAELAQLVLDGEGAMERLQSSQWSRRILIGLLGDAHAALAQNTLCEKRLGELFWYEPTRQVLTDAYSGPRAFTGPGLDFVVSCLQEINERAEARLGKPLFDLANIERVRYLGLWG